MSTTVELGAPKAIYTPGTYWKSPSGDEVYVLGVDCAYHNLYLATEIKSGTVWGRPEEEAKDAVEGLEPYYGTITIQVTP